MSDNYCNNCGKIGHIYNQCKMPITSIGIIAFRHNENKVIEYLMIRRKDTLGFIDFMRGKYYIQNKFYILNMLKQMTVSEKELLKTRDFDELWCEIWGNNKISTQYKYEENISKTKFNSLKNGIYSHSDSYNLHQLIDESNKYDNWSEPEWGFPKGRRNFQENDYTCALREFTEETGIDTSALILIENVIPYEEIFTGSNYKSYKHKYYVAQININEKPTMPFQESEVSDIRWSSYEEAQSLIRPYNLEKFEILTRVNILLKEYRLYP